jgi:CheY-like chemotaxis protein
MTNAALHARIQELESLCHDVYVASVERGFPHTLLQRLWNVVGNGAQAHATDLESATPAHGRASSRGDSPPQTTLQPIAERRTVLVADDDPLMLDVLTRILRRENYEMLVARDGGEALQKAGEHGGGIDLLITDCEMPVLKGPALAEKMRARYPGLKVLYQTGFSDMLFESRPVLDDDSTFLEKPFTARGLIEAARLSLFGAVNPKVAGRS